MQSRISQALRGKRALGTLIVVAGWLSSVTAHAEGDANAGAEAKTLLSGLGEHSKDPTVKEAMQHAAQALDRAAKTTKEQIGVRKALDAAALEWARVASSWVRVLERERVAKKLEESAATLRTQLGHARALLEETHARKQRAQSLLEASKQPGTPGTPAPTPETTTQPTSPNKPASSKPEAP